MENKKNFYTSELYDLSGYSFRRTTLDSHWDKFIEQSPHGTIFSSSKFLKATQHTLGLWRCYKKHQLVGQILTGEKNSGSSSCNIPYVVYSGIIAASPPDNSRHAQTQSENFRLTAAVIKHLSETYDAIELRMSPHYQDMRPFLWHNYGSKAPKFSLNLRYTSYIQLEGAGIKVSIEENPVYKKCSKSRRQEIRYGFQNSLRTEALHDVEAFLDLYRQTFSRQKIQIPTSDIDTIHRIIHALNYSGDLKMWGTYTSENQLANVCVFGSDSKRAYYLFGASDPKHRDSAAGTFGLFQSMNNLADIGHTQVDLEGVNSPKRGHFKLSFGGSLCEYYELSLTSVSN